MTGMIPRLLGAVTAVGMVASAEAGIGFLADASSLQFSYQRNQGDQGPYGTIQISDNIASRIMIQKLNLGGDGKFGGADDIIVDLAGIGDSDFFSVSFVADVYRLGANNYEIHGMVGIGDIDSPPDVILGTFSSEIITVGGGVFAFSGGVANGDGILKPDNDEAWTFTGLADDTPDVINGVFGGADGVDGALSIASSRGGFRHGSLLDFQFVGQFSDLDAFFGSNFQSSTTSDLKMTIVPIPGVAGLLGLGLAAACALRRRLGA